MNTQFLKKLLKRAFLVAPGVLLLGIFALFTSLVVMVVAGERLARAVAPPDYPRSELIERRDSGGGDIKWDRRTYRTTDDMDTVLDYYESYMPGFIQSEHREAPAVYTNTRCNDGALASLVTAVINGAPRRLHDENLPSPCVSVTIFPDPNIPAGTRIWLWLDWPAP